MKSHHSSSERKLESGGMRKYKGGRKRNREAEERGNRKVR